MNRKWTADEEEYLRQNYPGRPNAELAAALGRTVRSIYEKAAKRFQLRKSTEFISALRKEAVRRLADAGKATRLKPGLVPWNKGKPHPSTGKTVETQFKPGHRPHLWHPIGSRRASQIPF